MDPLAVGHRPFAGISGMHRPAAEDSEWSKAINASFDFDEAGFLRLLRRISATVDEEEASARMQWLSARSSELSRPEIVMIDADPGQPVA
ncbi:hypothetical protein H2202_002379 [Exophiala xenobiotica]|nr:hypothetical protein H2202_002379 [Exophiala xenobiotica]